MVNILIIDDKEDIREILADIVNLKFQDAKVIGFAKDVKSGIAAIEKYKPALVLLDIKLPDGTGFDILNNIDSKLYKFQVIFITAYEEYAVRAFKFSAIDYLLKPVDPDELIAAIEKVRSSKQDDIVKKIDTLAFNTNKQNETKRIVLKTQESIHIIDVSEIIRCEADGNYTTFYTSSGKKVIVSQLLKEYEELFKEYGFFRTHQSHLINLNYMKRFEKKDGGYAVMKDDSLIPVAQRKKELFLKTIAKIS